MPTLGLEDRIVDPGVYDRTAERRREARLLLPTFAEFADPTRIPDAVRHALAGVKPDEAHPLNLFRVHWYDDETYDWQTVVAGMLASGGRPVVVGDERLAEAWELGQAARSPVDPTGTAGLAGLLQLLADGATSRDERVTALFTGVRRSSNLTALPARLNFKRCRSRWIRADDGLRLWPSPWAARVTDGQP